VASSVRESRFSGGIHRGHWKISEIAFQRKRLYNFRAALIGNWL
jgi:hypothetical protein